MPPTDFESSTYPNRPGIRRYEKIVRFASIAGLPMALFRAQRSMSGISISTSKNPHRRLTVPIKSVEHPRRVITTSESRS